MYRLLILAVALPFLGIAELGRADGEQYDVEIVAIDLAGRRTNLTRNPAWDSSPAVARDGRIVFLSTRDGAADFYVMDRGGRNVRRLTIGQGVWSEALEFSQASWSPRGDKIAFDSLGAPPTPGCLQRCANWDVRLINADGSELKQVAVHARGPAWSRDGRRLAYVSGTGPEWRDAGVTIDRLDGSAPIHLRAFLRDTEVAPVWSPMRDELAFHARPAEGSTSWIYVVGADGRRKRRLARGHDPAWSRDGSRLAFIDDYTLFTIGRNGKRKRRLSRKGEFVIRVASSPRGNTLAFVAGTTAPRFGGLPRNLRVKTVSADGKRVRVLARLGAGSSVWGPPVWTPDGRRMLVAVEAH